MAQAAYPETHDGTGRSERFPIWPCTARSLPGRRLLPVAAGELLPHRFTHHPEGLVYSLLHLSSPFEKGARELPGPLPYGVRTFLFRRIESDRPTRFIARLSDYSKDVQQSKND